MTQRALQDGDLALIALVATRRFGGEDGAAAPVSPAALPADAPGRAVAMADAMLGTSGVPAAGALLALLCQLALDGLELIAPQGAVAGMIQQLRDGAVEHDAVARWLTDRTVPAATNR